MRTEVWRYLIAVDEQHSVSKAANKLYISKSALSESISQLERELNVAIFQRTKKGVVTTAAGQQILEQAKVILENVEKMYQISFSAPPLINYASTITFGVGEKFAMAGLSESISFILQKYPDVIFNAINMNSKQCLEAMANQEIQFAITGCVDYQKDDFLHQLQEYALRYLMLFDDPIYAVVNKSSPLAQKKCLSKTDYTGSKIITYSDYNQQPLHNIIYLSTFDNILQLLNDNVGISFFPYTLVKSSKLYQQDNLAIIPVNDMVQCNFIIYPAKEPLPELHRLFMMLYKQRFERWVSQ